MFKKLFKKLRRKEIETIDVPRAEIKRAEVERVVPFNLKYRDVSTGEVFEIEWTSENFDKVMSNRNAQLIFG